MLAATVIVAVVARGSEVAAGQFDDIRRVSATVTALCAFAVFALSRATWRQIGDHTALWAGTAALAVGIAAASRPQLIASLLGGLAPEDRWLIAAAAAALTVVPVLFAAGLVPLTRRTRMPPALLTIGTVAAVAVLTPVMRAVPRLGTVLAVSQITPGADAGGVLAGVAIFGIWLALAVGYTVYGLRHRWLYAWSGLILLAVTLAGVAGRAAGSGDSWVAGAALLEAFGMLLALVGAYLELTSAFQDQSLRLLDSALEAETAEVRERVRATGVHARRHDLVNAIMAIDGAAMILEREFDRLSGADRETLARVVGSGTAKLRSLLAQETRSTNRVSLAEAAADVAENPGWDVPLEIDVTADLVAKGSQGETAEAVRQLVHCAAGRSGAGPVTLRGERDGDWVVLRVEDRGPTMPRELRRTITETDRRRESGRDDAMGVQVAAQLMRGQGGDLWVEARLGGGTSFGICLPAVAMDTGDAEVW
jgi:signal transduction histidine kinase